MAQVKGLRTTNAQVANEILTDYKVAIEAYRQADLPIRSILCAEYKSDTGGPVNITFAKESMTFQQIAEGASPDFQKTDYTGLTLNVAEYALRTGVTRIMIEDSRFDEVTNALNEARRASDRLILTKVLGQAKTGWYNADGTIPPDYATNTFDTGHTHVYNDGAASAQDTSSSGGITVKKATKAIQTINEHGFSADTIFVHSAQLKEVQDLAAFTAGGVPMQLREGVQLEGRVGKLLGLDVVVNDWIDKGKFLIVDTLSKPLAFVERRPLTVEDGEAGFGIVSAYLSQRFGVGTRYRGAGAYVTCGLTA